MNGAHDAALRQPGLHPARADLIALCDRGPDLWEGIRSVLTVTDAARPAAVLVLFGMLDSEPGDADGPVSRDLDVLLLRRASTLGSHAGQVAFPGGRLDPGENAVEAALREAVEETGLDADGVEVLGILPELPVTASDHLVTPVLAWWPSSSEVAAVDHNETVEVFRVPVVELLDPVNRGTSSMVRSGQTVRSPTFQVGDRIVWGFTGRVLGRLFGELGWELPWDASRLLQPRAEDGNLTVASENG